MDRRECNALHPNLIPYEVKLDLHVCMNHPSDGGNQGDL